MFISMQCFKILMLVGVVTASGTLALSAREERLPNILLVVSDDHSAPYLGAYGVPWLRTPNFDAFAAEGVRFDRMFVAAPHCVPSRAALMTGRSPVAIRMGRFHTPMPPEIETLPELLRPLGYRTGISGRNFHLDGVHGRATDLTKSVYERHGMRTWHRRVDSIDISNQYQTVAKLEEFLDATEPDRPWFFWINYNDPHHRWDEDASDLRPEDVVLPAYLPDLPEVRWDFTLHCREIERMDRLFGDALKVLRTRRMEESTIVVFIGDNGMAFAHGKGSLYDPGINVPFLMRWPARVTPAVSAALLSGEDLAPTLLEAVGAPVPELMSGRSFWGLLTGGEYEPREYVYAARLHHGMPMSFERTAAQFDLGRTVRSERWKFIYNCTPHMPYAPIDSWREPSWAAMVEANRKGTLAPDLSRAYFALPRPITELYDLVNDPNELNNLSGRPEYAAVEQALKEALTEKMMLDYDFLPPPLQE